MVNLFLSTALIISSAGCGSQQQVLYDQEGNPIVVEEDDDDVGFFGRLGAPFGFSKRHSSGVSRAVGSPGVIPGSTSSSQNADNVVGRSGSTSTSGGSSSTGGTGITSGSHGGIGGGGSSAS